MLGTYFGALIILAGVLVIARKDIRLKGGKRDKRNLRPTTCFLESGPILGGDYNDSNGNFPVCPIACLKCNNRGD